MTDVSDRFREAMNAPETDEVLLVFLEISHPDLDGVLRFVSNNENIVRRGQTFYAYPFSFELPIDDPEQAPVATLTIGNVIPDEDGETSPEVIAQWRKNIADLRAITGYVTVTAAIALASTPDVDEFTSGDLTLTNISSADPTMITGTLSQEDMMQEPYPGDSFTPGVSPGIF